MGFEKLGRVFFRADGNATMGLGHVIRSLALLQMLKEHFSCVFIVRDPSESVIHQIQKLGCEIIVLAGIEDHLEEARSLVEHYFDSDDLVVLDGYHFDADYQKILKSAGLKIVAIDDMHSDHFLADAVINHGGGVHQDVYSLEPYTRTYLGPEYALLRPEFLKAGVHEEIAEKIASVFVCFGGADPKNLSAFVVTQLLKHEDVQQIHLVVGGANPFLGELEILAKGNTRIKLWHDIDASQMVSLIRGCDLAIVPASGISYEVAATGIPMLVGRYVDNQNDLYRFLVDNNLALGLADFQNEAVWETLPEREELKQIGEAQRLIFDGRSGYRCRSIFYDLSLSLREAEASDCDLYFQWANDPEVRANSLNSSLITWEDHVSWFNRSLNAPNKFFFLVFLGKEPVGQVRFEIQENKEALISYSIGGLYRGRGLGKIILERGMQALFTKTGIKRFRGYIKEDNIASQAVFEGLNFQKTGQNDDVLEYIIELEK